MGEAVARRGPDGAGQIVAAPVALAHRRLALLDPEGGIQPMATSDGGHRLVYNGEIFHPEELPASPDIRSDTARLLQALAADPLGVLPRLDGQFAFALWNSRTCELLMARDRFGIKPLFYAIQDGEIVFASDARAVLLHPLVSRELDRASIAACFALNHVPAPASIYRDVRKLPPGHALVFGPNGLRHSGPYRSVPAPCPAPPPAAECAAIVRDRLRLAVRRQLRADVPAGLLLSGGLDSSSLAVLAAQESPVPLDSFSLGFEEATFDESSYARDIAQRCGFRHHHERLTGEEAAGLLAEAVGCLDEPLFDPSLLPTYALARRVRSTVKAVLGGDGGDELFGGYPAFQAHLLAERLAGLPGPLWKAAAAWGRRLPVSWGYADRAALFRLFLQNRERSSADRFLAWMGLPGFGTLPYLSPALRQSIPSLKAGELSDPGMPTADDFELLRLAALRRYLQDHVLAKVDRASMAHGVEVRVPFLDNRLADFALSLPFRRHVELFRTKCILKDAMRGLVPDRIRRRRKAGFMFPLAAWLAGPLFPVLRDACAGDRLARGGLFDPVRVRMLFDEHIARRADHGRALWSLLVFQLWMSRYESGTV